MRHYRNKFRMFCECIISICSVTGQYECMHSEQYILFPWRSQPELWYFDFRRKIFLIELWSTFQTKQHWSIVSEGAKGRFLTSFYVFSWVFFFCKLLLRITIWSDDNRTLHHSSMNVNNAELHTCYLQYIRVYNLLVWAYLFHHAHVEQVFFFFFQCNATTTKTDKQKNRPIWQLRRIVVNEK